MVRAGKQTKHRSRPKKKAAARRRRERVQRRRLVALGIPEDQVAKMDAAALRAALRRPVLLKTKGKEPLRP